MSAIRTDSWIAFLVSISAQYAIRPTMGFAFVWLWATEVGSVSATDGGRGNSLVVRVHTRAPSHRSSVPYHWGAQAIDSLTFWKHTTSTRVRIGIVNVNAQKRVSVDNLMGSPGRPRWGGMIQTLVVQSRKQTRPVTAMREASVAPGADASDFLDVQTQWGALGGGEGPGSAAPRDDLVWVVLEDSCRLLAFAADSAQLLLKLDLFKKLLGALELFFLSSTYTFPLWG